MHQRRDDEETRSRTIGEADKVREAFDALPILAAALEGPELRYTATSASLRSAVKRSQLIGLPMREACGETVEQRLLDLFEQVYASGEPVSNRDYRVQWLTDSGDWLERYFDFTVVPTRAADGRVSGILTASLDVTESVRARKAAEAEAVESERRHAELRDVVRAMQAELMPSAVPVLPGLRLAASYVLAEADTGAGGDWFDAFTLPDGRVALIVGDVVGHGVAATAAMGQLRVVLRERLEAAGDLAEAVAAIDRLARAHRNARAATVCIVVLDTMTGEMTYCTAGHPPPLVVSADGRQTRYLVVSGAGPLGVGSEFPSANAQLEDGEILLLYTDGITERPGVDHPESATQLARAAADIVADRVFRGEFASPVDRLATHTVELLTRVTGHTDDITLLAAARRAPVGPLRMEVLARPAAFADLREAVLGWLDDLEAPERDRLAVELSVTELVANAIEHAYPPGQPGPIRIDADLRADGVVQIVIADEGRWRPPGPPPDTSGRGLWMAGAVVDSLILDHCCLPTSRNGDRTAPNSAPSKGTTITVQHRLGREATIGSGHVPPALTMPRAECSITLEEGQPRRLLITGALDMRTAETFADRISTAGRGGVHPLVIDLTGAASVASAGVTVLFEARDEHAAHGNELRILTAPGSLPARVLDLVGLEHSS